MQSAPRISAFRGLAKLFRRMDAGQPRSGAKGVTPPASALEYCPGMGDQGYHNQFVATARVFAKRVSRFAALRSLKAGLRFVFSSLSQTKQMDAPKARLTLVSRLDIEIAQLPARLPIFCPFGWRKAWNP